MVESVLGRGLCFPDTPKLQNLQKAYLKKRGKYDLVRRKWHVKKELQQWGASIHLSFAIIPIKITMFSIPYKWNIE